MYVYVSSLWLFVIDLATIPPAVVILEQGWVLQVPNRTREPQSSAEYVVEGPRTVTADLEFGDFCARPPCSRCYVFFPESGCAAPLRKFDCRLLTRLRESLFGVSCWLLGEIVGASVGGLRPAGSG